MYLYERLSVLRDALRDEDNPFSIPAEIKDNISKRFVIRPYQEEAFQNFILYYENPNLRAMPTQVLFHMATGSGKTLIMAGLILYLFKKGYRNFLFFVNLSNIVQKTKENFLNSLSSKYLFDDEMVIDSRRVTVRVVDNFQDSRPNSINICFTTTQGLHMDMNCLKEGCMTFADFSNNKVVLISDEAHHLNVDTRRMTREERDEEEKSSNSWEYTVNRILNANNENILLEFTATCDLENPAIHAAYENKIICDYPLRRFRAECYSKEIKTLESDFELTDRALQAIILSQYRYKIFQENHLNIKPVVLFQSKRIKENESNMQAIIGMIKNLKSTDVTRIFDNTTSETLKKSKQYFENRGITPQMLVQELKESFSEEKCISANSDSDVEKNQIALNSLEDSKNPYRAVFAVDKLNEGWDVLNLFDIVRLYKTRDGRNGVPGRTTIKEAQLIGRGARYCPFSVEEDQDKYKRKYDSDLTNPLRVCEELFYHCFEEPRYISELKTALREIGIDLDGVTECTYELKESFKKDDLYISGYLFVNNLQSIESQRVHSLPQSIRDKVYTVRLSTGTGGEDIILEDNGAAKSDTVRIFTYHTTFADIFEINSSIVKKAMFKYDVFRFNILKQYYPNLKTINDFICDDSYLGNIKIDIVSKYESPSPELLLKACINVLETIANYISNIKENNIGTKEFKPIKISDAFTNKKCLYTDIHPGGRGVSQNDDSVPLEWRMDLSKEDWYVFTDNYGTSEEKAFVAYFKNYYESLRKEYDKVYLIRNERQIKIFSFEDGGRFEPDYVLILQKNKGSGYEQLQIFIEPKGTPYLDGDAWKEKFLLCINRDSVPVKVFKDENDYFIEGFHFFNQDTRMEEFNIDFETLLSGKNTSIKIINEYAKKLGETPTE